MTLMCDFPYFYKPKKKMVSVFSGVFLVEGTLAEGEMGSQMEMLSWKACSIDVQVTLQVLIMGWSFIVVWDYVWRTGANL